MVPRALLDLVLTRIEARHAAVLQVAGLGAAPADAVPDGRARFYPGDNTLADIDGAVLSA